MSLKNIMHFFFLSELYLWHTEVPKLAVELELHLRLHHSHGNTRLELHL